MKRSLVIIASIIGCLLVGFIGSLVQTNSLHSWYPMLQKSMLTPPDEVFGIAWTILYILMGTSVGIVISTDSFDKKFTITLFSLQLFLNFGWSILFFTLQNPLLGLIDIVILDILVVGYIVRSWPISKLSSILCWPYLLWIIFATYLNAYIWAFNL